MKNDKYEQTVRRHLEELDENPTAFMHKHAVNQSSITLGMFSHAASRPDIHLLCVLQQDDGEILHMSQIRDLQSFREKISRCLTSIDFLLNQKK